MTDTEKKKIKHCHNNALFKLFSSINYCMICSSFFLTNCSSNESKIKTIKPYNYSYKNNDSIPPCSLWTFEEKNETNYFINKRDYLKHRAPLIKNIKKICFYFSLSLKTYFLSIEYLDIISSKISSFNSYSIFQISMFCLILAAKFNEQPSKVGQIQSIVKNEISKNYILDESYVLKVLNYRLNIKTAYDILQDILNLGFIFEGENVNKSKINFIYANIEKIIYFCSEINFYIELNAKQISISMIGFARELLDLTPFNDTIKKIFLIKKEDEEIYNIGLQLIKKKIKIEGKYKNENNIINSIDKTNEEKNTIAIFCNEYKKIVE